MNNHWLLWYQYLWVPLISTQFATHLDAHQCQLRGSLFRWQRYYEKLPKETYWIYILDTCYPVQKLCLLSNKTIFCCEFNGYIFCSCTLYLMQACVNCTCNGHIERVKEKSHALIVNAYLYFMPMIIHTWTVYIPEKYESLAVRCWWNSCLMWNVNQ